MPSIRMRTWHRQVGLWASLWLVVAALTALVLNHRNLFLPVANTVNGPYGQYLLSHAICASQPELVLVGTSSGLFESHDGGRTFTPINLPVPAVQVVAVEFHPNEPSHLYAVLQNGGIYSSLDSGKLWTKVAFPSQAPIHSFHVGFDGSLSVVTREGLHRRAQETWTLVPRPADNQSDASRAWLRLTYSLHDGQFWGQAGVLITDLVALSLLWLVWSGWWMWWKQRPGPDAPNLRSAGTDSAVVAQAPATVVEPS